MMRQKVSFEDSLGKAVVSTGRCAGCAACVLVCPFKCLEYANEKPSLVKECEACGICLKACPRLEWRWPEMESFVFGRERRPQEHFGIYRSLAIAQANDARVLDVCQDGGVVTALLVSALRAGTIDGAVASGVSGERPFFPEPRLVETAGEALECAGTRYSYSPNLLALEEAIHKRKDSLAFVGTPCQVQAIRKMQASSLRKYVKAIKFTVGLMCTESFSYTGLVEGHMGKLGVKPSSIRKMNIKGKLLVTLRSGEVKTIPLSEAKKYTREGCKFCDDFSSELADISVGGLGLSGWTFTIVRTPLGEELFKTAQEAELITARPVKSGEFPMKLLVKLSKAKRKRAST